MRHASHRAFASLWRACTDARLSIVDAKRMEVWEVAAALGVGFTSSEKPEPRAGRRGSDHDILRARIAAAKGEAAEPQASANNPTEVSAMMAALNQ